eukprot:c28915_g1_i1 orf=183-1325(-)
MMGMLGCDQRWRWQLTSPNSIPRPLAPLPSSISLPPASPAPRFRVHAHPCPLPHQYALPQVEEDAISSAGVEFLFRSPHTSSPCPFSPGFSFCTLLPTLKQGDNSCNVNGATPLLFALKIAPLFLLGLGAFFNPQLPALADLGRQGGATAVLRGATVPEILNSGWAGLMAGCLHTLAGPDHLAALAPLCIGRGKIESAIVGTLWGCGHDAGQIIFGLFFLLLKGKLKIELLQVWASRVVGITLLAIGAVGLKEAQEVPVSVLAAESPGSSEIVENKITTHRLRTFATGIIYGLQPDALIMILPALALPSRLAGAAYLGMFLIGTIVAMGSYTAFLGSCGQALEKRLPWITQRLTIISSAVAIIFGIGVLLSELFGINFFL